MSEPGNIPVLPPRWSRGEVGREILSAIEGLIRERLREAGIDGRYISGSHIIGTVASGVAKLGFYLSGVLVGRRPSVNFSSAFDVEDDPANDRVNVGLVVDSTNQTRISIVMPLGNGSGVIAAGFEDWLELNFDGVLEGWVLEADQSGSLEVDVWMDTYAGYPPTIADSICGGSLPTLTTQNKNRDDVLYGWSTAFQRGDTVKVHVNSATTVTYVVLTLLAVKT